jgi:hypothetical protein
MISNLVHRPAQLSQRTPNLLSSGIATDLMLEGTDTDTINSPYVRLSSDIHSISFKRAASKDKELQTVLPTSYRTSTADCLSSSIFVYCLFGESIAALGSNGENAARENAEETKVRWKGIGWRRQNTLEVGRYS